MISISTLLLACCFVSGAATSQIGPAPWQSSTIEAGVFVTEVAQVLESYEYGNGQSNETQHVAYSIDSGGTGLVRYARRSRSNGAAWPATWTVDPGALICSEPSLAVGNDGRVFLSCVTDMKVLVYWRASNGTFTLGLADTGAPEARNGAVALHYYSSGALRGIHIAYQKRNANGSRIVAHRWCSAFPNCQTPSSWSGDEVPLSNPSPARVGLVASTGYVQVAVPKSADVWFYRWYPIGGWDGSGQKPAFGSVTGPIDEVAFKRNVYGKLAAVTAGTSAYLVEWDTQQDYPRQYSKASGSDIVDTDHIDVLFADGPKPVLVYQVDGAEDLTIARRSPIGNWEREVVVSSGEVGRWPRLDQDVDSKYVITHFDRSLSRLRSVVGN